MKPAVMDFRAKQCWVCGEPATRWIANWRGELVPVCDDHRVKGVRRRVYGSSD